MGRNCGNKSGFRRSPDLYGDLPGERLAVGTRHGEGISGRFCGLYLDAAAVRGPHGVRLRLECHGFGVGHAVADLCRLTAPDFRVGVERLDREFAPAQLLDGRLIALVLPLRPLALSALV